MINALPKFLVNDTEPSFYEVDSLSHLELDGVLHAKINELIESFNALENKTEQDFADLIEAVRSNAEIFETAIRQELQDFIGSVNLEIARIYSIIDPNGNYNPLLNV